MSISTKTTQTKTIDGSPERYAKLQGTAMMRGLSGLFIGGWSELWLGLRWRMKILPTVAEMPVTGVDPTLSTELYWAFGLQVGQTNSWNAGSGTIDHMLGIKSQASGSTDTLLATSAGTSKDYLKSLEQALLVENGVSTLLSPAQDFYLPLDEDIRNVSMLRFVRDASWTVSLLRSNAETGVETDFSLSDIHTLVEDNATWAELVSDMTPYGYATVDLFASQAIDVVTNGEFDNVFLSWHPRYLECQLSDVFGTVKA